MKPEGFTADVALVAHNKANNYAKPTKSRELLGKTHNSYTISQVFGEKIGFSLSGADTSGIIGTARREYVRTTLRIDHKPSEKIY